MFPGCTDSIMPDTIRNPLQSILKRILLLWVKPDYLPANPAEIINPELPVLYVLEVGGAADTAALESVTRQLNLPSPASTLRFGSVTLADSTVVLQQRKGSIFRKHRKVVSRRLSELVAVGCSENIAELQIIPISVYWGRAPDKESSFWKLWYSENWQFAGRTRKLFTTILHGRNTLLSISEPLSFNVLRESGESADILGRKLSRILRVHFRQRRIAVLGPDQSHRRMLVSHVLSDTAVRKAIQTASTTSSRKKAQENAQKYANEIAADVSYPTVRILHKLLTRLWNELYDGVELHGIDRLKAVVDGHEIVYVPCHRSHIDYLLLSYILYVQGFSLPHIAAGINLNLPVVGGLLRRGGAFFLRRSFAGNPLYAAVFNAYLKEILQRGYALEYFVEGGRSRTGRLLPPKGGMLAMTVHAYIAQPRTPVVFVPVYFGYERLLEGRAFTSELAGGKKQRETVFALIKSLKTLREDYGLVHVNIGQPIDLDDILERHQANWRHLELDDGKPAWVKPVVDELGDSIMRNINEAACVTPIGLLAITILATPMGCISHEELQQQIRINQKLLKIAHAGTQVTVPEVNIDELIKRGIRLGFIESDDDAIGCLIQIRRGQSAALTYFRNNILHLLTLPAIIAATFSSQRLQSTRQINHLVSLAFPIFKSELFLPNKISASAISQTLDGLSEAGLLQQENNSWARAPAGSLEALSLVRLAQIVTPALERYYLCACLIAQSKDSGVSETDLARQCELGAARLARTHGRAATELFDKHLHRTFIDTLNALGYVSCDNNTVIAKPSLFALETEAREMLPEPIRHAIISLGYAALNPNC